MNWTVLKSLHQLFLDRKTKVKHSLKEDSSFQLLVSNKEIIEVGKNYLPGLLFDSYYKKHHLNQFPIYFDFLKTHNLLKKRFEEEDIKTLIELQSKKQSGNLIPNREQLIEAQETVRGFSTMFFKNDKYLDKKDSLIKAINQILDITLVENKDQQYLYILQCKKPELIVLCENLDFLRKDKMPRENNYELWYAGGKNVPKLKYADTRGLPIFYSADWDADGLEIYELAKEKIPELQLLFPTAISKSIVDTEHSSHWKNQDKPEVLSNLSSHLYSEKYKAKIKKLIETNHWIIEESNDLKKMIQNSFS
ncbi:hypothetical protein [Algibacter lectus]|uniref:Wadjet protein JetD C-terminal domain-containing protein n=1 Tax=Algibacter lectus TaxID=221126 RepID=A0A4R8M5Z7_9FLAO|nr:hypothetical protein [Algibacter lectus]MWW26031.1 hypothetical protein [Algibacter lectus]TDY60759.1 hypothetical protein DFQ06_3343 [Algibacter lectus]